MEQAQTASFLHTLDPKRIAGYSVTISLHLFAMLMLLAPLQQAPTITKPEVVTVVEESRKPPKPRPLPPPPRPVTPIAHAPVAPVPIAQPELIVDQEPAPIDAGSIPAVEDTGPITSFEPTGPAIAELQALASPAPPYPGMAIRRHLEGTVVLMILVGADGIPQEVTIEKSSGSTLLDEAAMKFVKARWRFAAAQSGGTAISAYARVPIKFSLDR